MVLKTESDRPVRPVMVQVRSDQLNQKVVKLKLDLLNQWSNRQTRRFPPNCSIQFLFSTVVIPRQQDPHPALEKPSPIFPDRNPLLPPRPHSPFSSILSKFYFFNYFLPHLIIIYFLLYLLFFLLRLKLLILI